MGVLLAFAVGYYVGARAGEDGFDEVAAAFTAIRESPEFNDFLAVMRDHASNVLHELAARLGQEPGDAPVVGDVLSRVRSIVSR